MNKIAVITTRFGSYLNYIDLWLLSVAHNQSIDFFIVTDIQNEEGRYKYPPNIHLIYTSFEQLYERFQKFFDFPIVMDRPYKITEYQPAFGMIFEEELQGYDFWGYCDTDTIFGDLRAFLSDDVLEKNERIYFKDHLTLYKNNKKMRELFLSDSTKKWTYDKAFKTPYICYFGEETMTEITRSLNLKYYNEANYADVLYKYFNFRLATETKNNTPQVFDWHNGKLFRVAWENGKIVRSEFSYIHLQKRNMKIDTNEIDKGFIIVPNKFISRKELTKEEIIKFGKDKLSWRLQYYWRYKLVGRLKKIKSGAIKERLWLVFRQLQ